MIITCPECATRYNVEDDRFLPDGHSVRCTNCGVSWFVPAPEALTLEPESISLPGEEAAPDDTVEPTKELEDEPRESDSLFDDVDIARAKNQEEGKAASTESPSDNATVFDVADENDVEDEEPRKSFFSLGGKRNKDRDERQEPNFFEEYSAKKVRADKIDERANAPEEKQPHKEDVQRQEADPEKQSSFEEWDVEDEVREASFAEVHDDDGVLDAQWEDVRDDGDGDALNRPRGFGRRMREERRRATAVTKVEPIDPRYFDEEFFEALRVQPRELEKALRKARRRAEAREKNRMTPLRALGWSAWIGAVAASVFAVVVYRDDVVRVAPRTAEVYEVLGVDTEPYGLQLSDVRHRLAMSPQGPTIEITGKLQNISSESLAAPLLQVEALGPDGELLSRWTFSAETTNVLSGAAANFMTRAPAPDGVVEVALSFAPDSPVRRR